MDDLGNRNTQDDPPDPESAAQGKVNELVDQEIEINQVVAGNVQEQIRVEIPPHPPEEWSFNNFLAEIARGINDKELNTLKLMFEGGLCRGVLEECNSCERFFSMLKTRRYISPGNIVYLNRMLDVLQRVDLIEKAARYCRTKGNVIHYYTSRDTTETDTNRVKFHIITNKQKMSRDTIFRLQNNVAKIVCAPVERVVIEEVMPGSSHIVIISLPDIHFHILKMFLEEKADLWELSLLEVDKIEINDKIYHLEEPEDLTESSQQLDFLNVYEQLQQKCEELEKVDFQALHNCKEIEILNKQLEKCQTKIKSLLQRIDMLQKSNRELEILISTFQEKYILSPGGKDAMNDLALAMQRATESGQDMDFLKRLLLLNTKTVAEFARNIDEAQREKEKAVWKERQFKEMELFHQLTTTTTSPEEIMQHHYGLFNPGHSLDDILNKFLRLLNEDLSDDDRTVLWKNYTWTEHDVTKACIDKDKSLFLAGILCKETIRTGCDIGLGGFIILVQQKTNRTDLIQKLKDAPSKLINNLLAEQLEKDEIEPEDVLTAKCSEYSYDGNKYNLDETEKNNLRRISNALSREEKDNILLKYKWEEKDVITKSIERDNGVFVLGMYCKESENKDKPVELVKYLHELLDEIGRSDLNHVVEKIKPHISLPPIDDRFFEKVAQSMIKTTQMKTIMQKIQKAEQEMLQQSRYQSSMTLDYDPFD